MRTVEENGENEAEGRCTRVFEMRERERERIVNRLGGREERERERRHRNGRVREIDRGARPRCYTMVGATRCSLYPIQFRLNSTGQFYGVGLEIRRSFEAGSSPPHPPFPSTYGHPAPSPSVNASLTRPTLTANTAIHDSDL